GGPPRPALGEAWRGLGAACQHTGQRGGARAAGRAALRLGPGRARTWFQLASLYEQGAEFDEAIAAYREAIRADRGHAPAWYNLAVLCREQGRLEDSVAAFLEAVRLRPRDPDAWFGLGAAYAAVGHRDGMIEVHNQLAILEPAAAEEFAATYLPTLSASPCERSASIEAGRAVRTGAAASPDSGGLRMADAWHELGVMYRKQGHD